jgi:hypothetical protein
MQSVRHNWGASTRFTLKTNIDLGDAGQKRKLSTSSLSHEVSRVDAKKTKVEATTSGEQAPSPDASDNKPSAAMTESDVKPVTDNATESYVFILWADGILLLLDNHTSEDGYNDGFGEQSVAVRLKSEVLEAAGPRLTNSEHPDDHGNTDVDEGLYDRASSVDQWFIISIGDKASAKRFKDLFWERHQAAIKAAPGKQDRGFPWWWELVVQRKEPQEIKNMLKLELRGVEYCGNENKEHEGVWWLTDLYPSDHETSKLISTVGDIMADALMD